MKNLEDLMQHPDYPRIRLEITCDEDGEFSGLLKSGFEVLIAVKGYTDLELFLRRFDLEAKEFMDG